VRISWTRQSGAILASGLRRIWLVGWARCIGRGDGRDVHRVTDELMFGVRVERWVRLRQRGEGDDPAFVLDEEGFLPGPGGAGSEELMRPQEAAGRGALVLLGEPGAGKTTTFTALTGANRLTPPPPLGGSGTVWVTGSDLTDAEFQLLVGDHLAALPVQGQVGEVSEEVVQRRLPRLACCVARHGL
jgi:hypothetical protein